MTFPPGTTVVLREVVEGRVRSARPLRVVLDDADRFVGYLVPRSTVAWPRLADGVTQSQTPDQGWQLPLEEWHGPGALFVMPAGAGFAVVLFFDRDLGTPLGWKVDFLRPTARHRVGFDTVDQGFDLLASGDLSAWEAKDLDDLAQLVRVGLLAGDELAAFEAERARVEGWLRRGGGGPFDEGWTRWRPEAAWAPLDLPDGWNDLRRHRGARTEVGPTRRGPTGGWATPDPTATGPASTGPATARATPPPRPAPRWRSATGIRLLDDTGTVHLDLDLAGGRAWLGHTPPGMAMALQRQLGLGWQLGANHPALDALGRRLADVLPAEWSAHWADQRRGADLDEALLEGWPVAVAERCNAAGETLGSFGPRLFGGFDRWLVVGPRSTPAEPGEPAAPGEHRPPDLLAAIAALETMQLAGHHAVRATVARAGRLRARCGLVGTGLVLAGPAGWAAPGVVVPGHGRGLLALCADDADETELGERLSRWSAP